MGEPNKWSVNIYKTAGHVPLKLGSIDRRDSHNAEAEAQISRSNPIYLTGPPVSWPDSLIANLKLGEGSRCCHRRNRFVIYYMYMYM